MRRTIRSWHERPKIQCNRRKFHRGRNSKVDKVAVCFVQDEALTWPVAVIPLNITHLSILVHPLQAQATVMSPALYGLVEGWAKAHTHTHTHSASSHSYGSCAVTKPFRIVCLGPRTPFITQYNSISHRATNIPAHHFLQATRCHFCFTCSKLSRAGYLCRLESSKKIIHAKEKS
jgi:hypothetical protein